MLYFQPLPLGSTPCRLFSALVADGCGSALEGMHMALEMRDRYSI